MASSSSLFIGIDESTKSTKRSFAEIEIGGQLCSTDPDLHILCVSLTMKKVMSHSTEKMLELILGIFLNSIYISTPNSPLWSYYQGGKWSDRTLQFVE